MALASRRYKLVGYDTTKQIYGVSSMGTMVDALGVTLLIRRTIQYETTQQDAGALDLLMGEQGWIYDP